VARIKKTGKKKRNDLAAHAEAHKASQDEWSPQVKKGALTRRSMTLRDRRWRSDCRGVIRKESLGAMSARSRRSTRTVVHITGRLTSKGKKKEQSVTRRPLIETHGTGRARTPRGWSRKASTTKRGCSKIKRRRDRPSVRSDSTGKGRCYIADPVMGKLNERRR